MSRFETWLKTDLKKPNVVVPLHGRLFTQDNMSNLVGVHVYDNGQPADSLDGSVTGWVMRNDGNTVVVNGTVDGSDAYIILPESAYAVPGEITITLRHLVGSGANEVKTTLAVCTGYVYRTVTGAIIDPGEVVPDLATLLAKIEEMEEATEAATQAAENANEAAETAGDIVKVSETQPQEEINKLWIVDGEGEEITIPTYEEHNSLKSALNKKINSFIEYDDDAFTNANYYYRYQDGVRTSTTGDMFYTTNSIPIPEEVNRIYVRLYQNVTLVAPVVFLSSPGVMDSFVVSINGTSTGIVEGYVDVPQTAKYVHFGLRDKSQEQYVQFIYDGLTEKLISLENTSVYNAFGNSETGAISQKFLTEAFDNTIPVNHRVSNFPNLGYIKPNGIIQADSSGNWGYTDLIQIPNGLQKISVKLYYNPSVISVCAFYNNAGTRIQAVSTITGATSGTVYTGDIPVPDGAYYFRATKRTADGEQYAEFSYKYDEIMTKAMDEAKCILTETLAKPFVLSGANAIGFGDSIMYGYRSLDVTDVSSNPWPNIVKDRFGFNNFSNKAVGGAGFTVGSTIITQMTGQTLNTRNYIFVAAGTNDYHYAATTDAFRTAVETAFDYIDENKGENTKVIVITPINRSQAPGNTNGASLNVYRSILTESALKRGYSVIDGREFGFPDFSGDYQEAVLPDGLHPNDAGYIMYANHVCGLIG